MYQRFVTEAGLPSLSLRKAEKRLPSGSSRGMDKEIDMDKQKEKQLYRRFPVLFRQALAPKGEQGCMAWGLSVGDGWHDLIVRISEAIEMIAVRHGLTPDEWPHVVQVKEKFGELRFTIRFESDPTQRQRAIRDEIYRVKEELASLSQSICERCGAPGVMRKQGWMHVYCDHCEDLYLRGLS